MYPRSYKLTLFRLKNYECSSEWALVRRSLKEKYAGYEFYKGMYFINNDFVKETTVVEANTGVVLYMVPLLVIEEAFLPLDGERLLRHFTYMESSGDLLLVFAFTYIRRPKLLFDVHRLEDGDGGPQWIKMRGIETKQFS
jgi:hypothetical protein